MFQPKELSAIFVCLMLGALGTPVLAESDQADTDRPAIEEILVIQSRGSDFTIITEQAQSLVELPGAMGDPILAAFSLPGVLFSAGDMGEPAVRGSSPNDNLYRVDGMPAGYVFHEFSTSIFNENIIQDFDLYSAGFGPQYGDVTGAVFDIRLRQPRAQDLATTVDLSFLRAGVFFEGSVTENSAFYLSARASTMHFFIDEDDLEEEAGIRVQSPPRDTDYQFKHAWRIDPDQTLTLSANGASDRARAEFTDQSDMVRANPDFGGEAQIDRQFDSQSLHWGRQLPRGAELALRAGHYVDRGNAYWGDDYFTDLRETTRLAKVDYRQPLSETHTFSMGAETQGNRLTYDTRQVLYLCTELDPDCDLRRGELVSASERLRYSSQLVYLNDYWTPTDTLALDLGVQWHYNSYTEGSFVHPRAALAWEFVPTWTLTSAAGSYNRFPDFNTVLPGFGNPELESPTANHYTLGLKRELDNRWSWNLEFYYKTLNNLPLAADPEAAAEPGTPLYTNQASGEAYGADLLINKGLTDRWYGWLAVSYARSNRRNDLTGEHTDYPLDTPLVVNLVSQYQLSENWNAGLRFSARSGQAHTPIVGIQDNSYFDEGFLPIYGDPFSTRLPTYRRLDVRFSRALVLFGNDGKFTIDVLNALNTRNVTDRNLDYERIESTEELLIEDSVSLGIFPSLGLSFTF